jgi:Fic family protein
VHFANGNGRVGRLLITLLLCAERVLRDPLLYLSLYLKQHRDEYYRLLTAVRLEGDWEAWIRFFVDGVHESATGAVATAQRLVRRAEEDRTAIARIGRGAGTAFRVHLAFQERPVASASQLSQRIGVSLPTILKSLAALEGLGIVHEMTGRKRNRVFSYAPYLQILSEGTEPL